MRLTATSAAVAAVSSLSVLTGGGAALATQPAANALPGEIHRVMVIDLENESYDETFGANSPVTYLTKTLEPQGTLLPNYYGIGHVSLDNYVAQISGQAPNPSTSSDCTSFTSSLGSYNDVTPGTLAADQKKYPGQVVGDGCVYPAAARTIADQLDARYSDSAGGNWREYAEDMGNDPARDGGTADPLGGTDCAHPTQTDGHGWDATNYAQGPSATGSQVKSPTADAYANRHNPFVYFHSIIDNQAGCDQGVVPLGTVTHGANGNPVSYTGHLAQDLSSVSTTPRFSFITPNLCNDGHDATCAGPNSAGTTAGGLTALNAWLTSWMPLILTSPAYRSGQLLVVITADEGSIIESSAGDNEQPGPNSANPGYSALLNTPIAAYGGKTYYQLLGLKGLTPGVQPPAGTMPGGGRIGALLLNSKWVKAGGVDATSYNHYSALRSYEDLLGITSGGADGAGHLGFAATATTFGPGVWTKPGGSSR
jgi:hypothetical protein